MPRIYDDGDSERSLTSPVEFGQVELYGADEYGRVGPTHKTNEVVRVAVVLGTTPRQAWVHSVFGEELDKQGMYHCLSEHSADRQIVGEPAECCLALNHDDAMAAKRVFGVTVVHYTTADGLTGKLPKEPLAVPFTIGWLRLSQNDYKKVSLLLQAGEKGTDFDFVVKARGPKGIGYDYERVAGQPRYMRDPAMKAAVLEAAALYLDGKQLQKRLGKVLPAADFVTLPGAQKPEVSYTGGE